MRIGRTAGHDHEEPRDVTAFTLDGGDRLQVTVWTYGATLHRVRVADRRGRPGDVVVNLPHLAHYEDRTTFTYPGSTMGRYARCISGARFKLDGVEHALDVNDPPHHIHGGTYGFDRFVWDAEAGSDRESALVRLRLHRPDGDQGYPGAVTAEATYTVHRDGVMAVEYRATTTAPTVVDLTNHAYWSLAGRGRIDQQWLRIGARRVLLVDAALQPRGDPVPVTGTAFDFTRHRPIGPISLDNCFALDGSGPAAELFDLPSGRMLRIETDQPGLQVYSGDGLHRTRAGICLQTGGWPDAPNRPSYPPARLDPGQSYVHRTTYCFLRPPAPSAVQP